MWIFALLIFALIAGRLILPLRLHPAWKIALSLPVLASAFKFQLIHLFGGPMFFAPQLPAWLLIASAWCYASVFMLFLLLLISETVQLCFRFAGRKTPEKIRNRIDLALIAAAFLLASYGLIRGTAMPEVREISLEFPGLPKSADGMTIALLADLHADAVTRSERIGKIAELTNSLQPDLIVIAGDFADGTVDRRGKELEPLRTLSAPCGVFGVPGNHEYYSGYADWTKFISGLGIRLLLNENCRLPNGIILSGVTDPAARRMGGEAPDLEKALKGIPANSFVVLLAHQPALAEDAAKQKIALQLSGHTHGGMIRGFDCIVARFNRGFVSGLYQVGSMRLYVSNGSGIWSGFPIRIGRDAEITLIRLTVPH